MNRPALLVTSAWLAIFGGCSSAVDAVPARSARQQAAVSIERQPVRSSAMRSVGYDAAARVLEIEFPAGTVYRYDDVPQHVYRGLMTADSKGRYFNAHIRNAGYSYARID